MPDQGGAHPCCQMRSNPIPSHLAAAVADLTIMAPNSPSALPALDVVLAQWASSRCTNCACSPLPTSVFRYLPGALAAFGEAPALDLGTLSSPEDLNRACTLTLALSESVSADACLSLFVRRGRRGRAARKGIYALLALAVSRPRGTAAWVSQAILRLGINSVTCLSNFLIGVAWRNDSARVEACGWILAEVFAECQGDLAAVLETGGQGMQVELNALTSVAILADADGLPKSPVGAVSASKVFLAGVVASVSRCDGSVAVRSLLCLGMQVLEHLLEENKEAEGLVEILGSDNFRRAVRVAQRELLKLSIIPVEEMRIREGEGVCRCGPFCSEASDDRDAVETASYLMRAIRGCPHAWEAAGAGRKTGSAYALLALVLRQHFVDAVSIVSEQIIEEMDRAVVERNEMAWRLLVKNICVEGGFNAALLVILQRPVSEKCFWIWGARLIAVFVSGLDKFGIEEGAAGVSAEMHPAYSRRLSEALVSNLVDLSVLIETVRKDVSCDDVDVLSMTVLALESLAKTCQTSTIESNTSAIQAVLHVLITLNAIIPALVVGLI